MAGAEAKASLVRGPVLSGRANSVGDDFLDGVASQVNTGAAQSIAIPTKYHGKFCAVSISGAGCRGGFSRGGAQAPTLTAAGTLEAPNVASGVSIPQDGSREWIIPPGVSHWNWISTAPAGNLELFIAEVLAING